MVADGPTAVVTGASGGIGSAIARRLADDGFRVVAGYHSGPDRAEELVASLAGVGHRTARISVLEPASLDALATDLAAGPGRLEVLVNCAGMTRPVAHGDLDGLDDGLIDEIFATNWRGPFAAIRALAPLLQAAGRDGAEAAVVVNISSIAAVTGQGSNVAYCASKAALDQDGPFDRPIVVPITDYDVFYLAEAYHQDYYLTNTSHYKRYARGSGRVGFLDKHWRDAEPLDLPKPYAKPSDQELRQQLTQLQYDVTQNDGTERPFQNEFWDNK
ncbi:MAG: SDR family NAD(P)-dependent oxidoreductase, partial [Actinomycetota bacterium]